MKNQTKYDEHKNNGKSRKESDNENESDRHGAQKRGGGVSLLKPQVSIYLFLPFLHYIEVKI